jgi:hypothetical protein
MAYFHKKFELCPRLKSAVGRGYNHNKILKISSFAFLVLAVGLSFNAIRLIYFNRDNQDLSAALTPQVLGASEVKEQNGSAQIQFVEYKVQKGDTLFNISQKFSINWSTLATLNNLKSPFALKPGQTLKVPR